MDKLSDNSKTTESRDIRCYQDDLGHVTKVLSYHVTTFRIGSLSYLWVLKRTGRGHVTGMSSQDVDIIDDVLVVGCPEGRSRPAEAWPVTAKNKFPVTAKRIRL